MSREIKFRAFDKWNKKITFDLYDEPGDIQVTNINGFLSDNSQYEFMQFTGLIDKNGVEIYEGDILELNNCGLLIVCFYKGEFKLQKLAEYHKKRNLYASISYLEFSVLRGNIYENPNLLQ